MDYLLGSNGAVGVGSDDATRRIRDAVAAVRCLAQRQQAKSSEL